MLYMQVRRNHSKWGTLRRIHSLVTLVIPDISSLGRTLALYPPSWPPDVVIVLLIFVGLAVLCDDYLVPWLQKIQRVCGMSDDMAGVTLVAFGSAAPELVISMVSVLNDDNKIGVGIICGSAIIAFGFIPAACFFAVNKPLLLNNGLVCRDVVFYLIGSFLLVLYFFIHDGNITIWQALSLVGLYLVYIVAAVLVPCALYFFESARRRRRQRQLGLLEGEWSCGRSQQTARRKPRRQQNGDGNRRQLRQCRERRVQHRGGRLPSSSLDDPCSSRRGQHRQ